MAALLSPQNSSRNKAWSRREPKIPKPASTLKKSKVVDHLWEGGGAGANPAAGAGGKVWRAHHSFCIIWTNVGGSNERKDLALRPKDCVSESRFCRLLGVLAVFGNWCYPAGATPAGGSIFILLA